MQTPTNDIQVADIKNREEFSPREFVMRYVVYLPWLIASIVMCLLLAYVYLRYSSYIYRASGKMLLKQQEAGAGRDRFEDIFTMQAGTVNLNDEIEQIKSTSIATKVVKALNLQTSYYNKGNIRVSLLTSYESPVRLNIIRMKDSAISYGMTITVIDTSRFLLNEGKKEYYFGQPFEVDNAIFSIEKTGYPLSQFLSRVFIANWQPVELAAKGLAGGLGITQVGDYSNVLTLTFESENPRLARDLVSGFMDAYQEANLEEKRQIATNTIDFIDEQLDTLRRELGGVERNLQNFRERNQALDVEKQSSIFLGNANELQRQHSETEIKLKLVDYLIDYLGNEKNFYRMVPATLGIQEPSLLQSITEYNKLQLQRETYLKTMPAGNPVIKDIEAALGKLRGDMIENLRNVRGAYVLTLNSIQGQNQLVEGVIGTVPGKQKKLLEITRQQKILEELYSFLLQKKLETSIGAASTVSNSRVIEPADFSTSPVKPHKRNTYILAVLAGCVLPVGIIFLKELLNDKVRMRSDVEKATHVPILGEIGHSESPGALVIASGGRSYVGEQFRIVRSNLQYFIPKDQKPVILVTSSVSGEGKSFISTNLAAVLALSGKRTLILEFDIRKPRVLKGLELSQSKGITNFIVGSMDLDKLIVPIPNVENLYVLPCGPIPPNPAELLLNERVEQLFEFARANFDAIVVDTAPIGLVSDAVNLSKFVNASIYIIRYDHTLKRQLKFIEELYKLQRLNKMALVINDVAVKGGYGGYYGYSYGYGYGYGYGYKDLKDYFDEGSKKKKKGGLRVTRSKR